MFNHLDIKDNTLGVSLLKYYVKVKIFVENSELLYKLRVYDEGVEKLVFIFKSLEDATTFISDVINADYYVTLEDIQVAYDEQYGDSELIKKYVYPRKNI